MPDDSMRAELVERKGNQCAGRRDGAQTPAANQDPTVGVDAPFEVLSVI